MTPENYEIFRNILAAIFFGASLVFGVLAATKRSWIISITLLIVCAIEVTYFAHLISFVNSNLLIVVTLLISSSISGRNEADSCGTPPSPPQPKN